MALYNWKCLTCGKSSRKLLPEPPKTGSIVCECGQTMVLIGSGFVTVMDRLDNGLMPRVLERPKDAVELAQDHAKDKKDPGIV